MGRIDMVEQLLSYHADINACPQSTRSSLTIAVSRGHIEIADLLLAKGADAKLSRPLISAILNTPPVDMEMTRMLVEHGALINECYHFYDNKKQPRNNPLAWAILHGKHEIAEYLRSKGAVMPPGQVDPGPPTLEQAIVEHFAAKLGPVQPLALRRIVPSSLPVAIHVVPPGEGRNCLTLFTTGMSQHAMKVPQGLENFRHAELSIQLPADWPLPGKSKPSILSWLGGGPKKADEPPGGSLWPIQWLQTIAAYPRQSGGFVGGPGVIFANGEPPEPIATGLPFTSFLLLNTEEIVSPGGKRVQMYQLLPIFTEERTLEMREGLPALINALDHNNISWIVDLKRPNVAIRR